MPIATTAQREAMYKRIFAGIPSSFLDPDHPNNRAVIGAIAYACAVVEWQFRQLESGLFLDSASTTDAGADGVSSLARWGIWLKMPQLPEESPDAYRLRLMQRLFTPKVTIAAIVSAIAAATGLVVEIEERYVDVFAMDAGPFEGKRVMGDVYAYMSIDVITHGSVPNGVVPALMSFLRAAGTHWRHIERVVDSILLSLDGGESPARVSARDEARLFPPLRLRPDMQAMDAGPNEPTYLYDASKSMASDVRTFWSPRVSSLVGPVTAIVLVEATTAPSPALPILHFADATTLWAESVWVD